jgi:hypothetical protein
MLKRWAKWLLLDLLNFHTLLLSNWASAKEICTFHQAPDSAWWVWLSRGA